MKQDKKQQKLLNMTSFAVFPHFIENRIVKIGILGARHTIQCSLIVVIQLNFEQTFGETMFDERNVTIKWRQSAGNGNDVGDDDKSEYYVFTIKF